MTGPIPHDRIRDAHDAVISHGRPVPIYLTPRLRICVAPYAPRLPIGAAEVGTYAPTVTLDELADDLQTEARALIAIHHDQVLRLIRAGKPRQEITRRTGMRSSSLTHSIDMLTRAGLIQRTDTGTYETATEARHD
jgi:hypothetical protein